MEEHMQYDFLKKFPKRMKNVGLYGRLVLNTTSKTTWNQYQFYTDSEQLNIVFAVLLFIMEQSLKEEYCTIDEIGAYIDNINSTYFGKELSFDDCRKLGDFIVNTILSNDGKLMHFDGYDFESRAYHIVNISYVKNRVVYINGEVKRTSYSLTDDGYNLMLSTLEVENNLKLTIHEMIFQMHLEKQSYDKAVDDIKNIFLQMRIQLQKIREAMLRIRRNALEYSVTEYEEILNENLNTITDTKTKFENYREHVRKRVTELEHENINIRKLTEKDEENLVNLKVISRYLSQTIDEHQKILNTHFDLKDLYTKELEQLAKVASIKRFSIKTDFYDEVIKNPEVLEDFNYFLTPLFNREIEKIYHPLKACEFQRPLKYKAEEDSVDNIDFDEEAWEREQERRRQEKKKKYESSVSYIIEKIVSKGEVLLSEMKEEIGNNEVERLKLIPTIDVFKEVMVEMIKGQNLDICALKKERSTVITDSMEVFEPNIMILDLLEKYDPDGEISNLIVLKSTGEDVIFSEIECEDGTKKSIRCSDVRFVAVRR